MPALCLALLLLSASPALAQDQTPGGDAGFGFPVVIVTLIVVATVFALVWRAVSKKKTD